jgi:hypothetical protein
VFFQKTFCVDTSLFFFKKKVLQDIKEFGSTCINELLVFPFFDVSLGVVLFAILW